MPFLDDLKRYGPAPDGSAEAVSRDDAWAYCDRLTRSHYENFSVVTWLTPRPSGPLSRASTPSAAGPTTSATSSATPPAPSPCWPGGAASSRPMFAGETPRHPVMVALAETVREFAIPIDPFEALIAAFEQDQVVTEYATYDQLLDYCDPVGQPGRAPRPLPRPRVHRRERPPGRPHLHRAPTRELLAGRGPRPRDRPDLPPREDRDAVRLPRRRPPRPPVHPRVRRPAPLRGRARREPCWIAGRALIDLMPRALAVDVDLFGRGGLAILDRIEAQGFDVWRQSARGGQGRQARPAGPGAARRWPGRARPGQRLPVRPLRSPGRES